MINLGLRPACLTHWNRKKRINLQYPRPPGRIKIICVMFTEIGTVKLRSGRRLNLTMLDLHYTVIFKLQNNVPGVTYLLYSIQWKKNMFVRFHKSSWVGKQWPTSVGKQGLSFLSTLNNDFSKWLKTLMAQR